MYEFSGEYHLTMLLRRNITIQSSPQLTSGEVSEGQRPSDVRSFPAAGTAETGAFLRREACRPEQKYLPCGFAARKPAGFQADPEGVASAGEFTPPSDCNCSVFD